MCSCLVVSCWAGNGVGCAGLLHVQGSGDTPYIHITRAPHHTWCASIVRSSAARSRPCKECRVRTAGPQLVAQWVGSLLLGEASDFVQGGQRTIPPSSEAGPSAPWAPTHTIQHHPASNRRGMHVCVCGPQRSTGTNLWVRLSKFVLHYATVAHHAAAVVFDIATRSNAR